MNLIIDNEFKTLIPPLTEEEFNQLEENCIENGIQDSLKVWNGILIDGHNRYEIAQKHGLEFKTDEMEFASRTDAKYWIIKNQLGRRNISLYDRSVLALKLKPVIAEKAKEKQGTRSDICQKSDKSIDTKKELAKVAGVSHDTIHKVDVIENSGNQELIDKVKHREISINKAYKAIKGKRDENTEKPATVEEAGPVVFIETEESHEEVSDVSADVTNTFSATIMEEIKAKTNELADINHFYRIDAAEEIKKVTCSKEEKEELKGYIKDCIKFLIHLETGLMDW